MLLISYAYVKPINTILYTFIRYLILTLAWILQCISIHLGMLTIEYNDICEINEACDAEKDAGMCGENLRLSYVNMGSTNYRNMSFIWYIAISRFTRGICHLNVYAPI